MSKVVAITGAAGFVGRKLAMSLKSQGYEVIALDVVDPQLEGIRYAHFDINKDVPQIDMEKVEGATFVHLAALSTDPQCKADPNGALNTNLTGTSRVIELVNKLNFSRFIFASSEWVYPESNSNVLQNEEDSLHLEDLNSLYAMTKLMGENLVRATCQVPFISLRFGIVYGPRTKPGSAPESIAFKIAQGENVSVGSIATARRFIFVDDLVKGICAAIGTSKEFQNEVFNLSGSQLVSLSDIATTTIEITNKQVKVNDGGSTASIRNPNPNKFMEYFNFTPTISLREGLKLCLEVMK